MITYSLILSSLLLLLNPIEYIDLSNVIIPNMELEIIDHCYYIQNCKIQNINKVAEGYSISVLSNNEEIITFAGLQEVYVKEGDNIIESTNIGKDYSIDNFCRFVLIPYKKMEKFPQIYNNKISFLIDTGSPVYSIFDAQIKRIETIIELGNVIELKNTNNELYVEYWHLMAIKIGKKLEEFVDSNEKIAYSGNVGISEEPHLGLFIQSNKRFESFKAIYFQVDN